MSHEDLIKRITPNSKNPTQSFSCLNKAKATQISLEKIRFLRSQIHVTFRQKIINQSRSQGQCDRSPVTPFEAALHQLLTLTHLKLTQRAITQ